MQLVPFFGTYRKDLLQLFFCVHWKRDLFLGFSGRLFVYPLSLEFILKLMRLNNYSFVLFEFWKS